MPESRPTDAFLEDLQRLAPDVDVPAALIAFSALRSRAARRRRMFTAAATTTCVALIALVAVTRWPDDGSSARVTAGPREGEPGPPVDSFPLPGPGKAASVLLDDGTPVWVVNHGDGTASAVPGLFPDPSRSTGQGTTEVLIAVLWDADGAFDVPLFQDARVLTWDPFGRAVNADRDLFGFSATVEGERAIVRQSDRADIPGDPIPIVRGDGRSETPTLPPLVPLTSIGPGWQQVEADVVVDPDGSAVLCKASVPDFPQGPPFRCASSSQIREVTVLPIHPMFLSERMTSPVVIHITDDMIINAVYPIGGTGGLSAPDN